MNLPGETGWQLIRLGLVAPPDPGVLDAARELLWAAVAAEMLATGEAGSGQADQRQADQRQADQRQADQPGQARRAKPDP